MSELRFSILAGPTAAGKTEIAIAAARLLQTEIVNADPFQLYDGLGLLTAQPTPEQLAASPHHLLGVLPLSAELTAAEYAQLARPIIESLNRRNIRPLVVGGSGFYLQALIEPLAELPKPEPKLRVELQTWPRKRLLIELQNRDPRSFSGIDRHNRRRVQRALEVCIATGRPFSEFRPERKHRVPMAYIDRSREELWSRINRRVDAMFAAEVVDQVRAVSQISETAARTIGFQQIQAYLRQELTLRDCIAQIKLRTRQYAKRQVTWFRGHDYARWPADEPIEGLIALLIADC
jgi:tRNA dimethylallyltransferase